MPSIGWRVYGLAALALGVLGLSWGDFSAPWQPVPADLPARIPLANGSAALFLLAGAALQWRRTAPFGALAASGLFLVFALLWGKRVLGFPQILGTWSGMAEEVALALGGLTIFAAANRTVVLACRMLFGVCLLVFCAAHFVYVKETAELVPGWLPPNTHFWAYATGAAHGAAGLALISGVLAPLASRLLTLMFVGFGALVWAPQLFTAPHAHITWGGNAMNLALIGAAWVIADTITSGRAAKTP